MSLSITVHKAILDIRERYEGLLDEVSHQNVILMGRLEEARAGHSCRASGMGMVKATAKNVMPSTHKDVVKSKPPKATVKKEAVKKKPLEVPVPPPKDNGAFTEVVSKKKRKKKRKGGVGAAAPGVPAAP